MPDPVTIGLGALKVGNILFGSSKKRKARRLQAQSNALRATATRIGNQLGRTQAAKSFLAAQAEGKVSSQAAGGTLRGSATQGNISGGRAAFAGSLSDATRLERMGLRANQFDAGAARQLYKASRVQDIIGGVSSLVSLGQDLFPGTPTTTTYAPVGTQPAPSPIPPVTE